ncbi:MAG: pre-toxin TG domain-containing protein, partial [Bdellovibrionales bacterium]
YSQNTKDGGLRVEFKFINNISIVRFEDEKINFEKVRSEGQTEFENSSSQATSINKSSGLQSGTVGDAQQNNSPIDSEQSVNSDNAQQSRAGSDTQNSSIHSASKNNLPGHGDFSVGISSGLMAGLQYALITDSKENQEISKAYEQIDQFKNSIGKKWEAVERAQIDLKSQLITVDLAVDERLQAPKIKSLSRIDFNNFDVRNLTNPDTIDLNKITWLSKDSEFINRAEGIRTVLKSVRVKDSIGRKYFDISKTALVEADKASFFENKEQADFLLDLARTSADVLVGLDPFTGFARSLYETITGENLITGNELSGGERVLAALGVVTAGYTINALRLTKYIWPLAQKMGARTIKTFGAIATFLNRTGQEFELVGKGSLVRKINLRSEIDAGWGLTPKHLYKHLFGEGELSLRKIDPGGNPDKWMIDIMDVIQRPVKSVTSNGKLDIWHYYQKSDGSGLYKLGVRLHPNADNSFDLITFLTKQN